MEHNREDTEKVLLDFLREHGEDFFTCALATCRDNEPRNTPVDARNDGLIMYFISDEGEKLENMRRNPKVCLAVFMPVGKGYMKNARGLQMWGTAHIITRQSRPEEFKRGFDTMRLDEISAAMTGMPMPDQMLDTLTMVKVVPDRIAYFDSTGQKPVKLLWSAEA